MNRKEFTRRIAATMRDKNMRKPVTSKKQVFHISDDEGNSKDFVVKKSNKTVMFTIEDVEAFLDATISVIEESLKQGEPISIHGFGTLGLHYRKARTTKHPETGEPVLVADRYIPKFEYGKHLRMCARIFELSLAEHPNTLIVSHLDDDPETEVDDYGN